MLAGSPAAGRSKSLCDGLVAHEAAWRVLCSSEAWIRNGVVKRWLGQDSSSSAHPIQVLLHVLSRDIPVRVLAFLCGQHVHDSLRLIDVEEHAVVERHVGGLKPRSFLMLAP